MRRILTYNYWLIIIAWCMFLNGYNLLANTFGIVACAVLPIINKRINHWRMYCVGLIIYVTILIFLKNSNVLFFFPKLSVFLAIVSLNASLTSEYQYLLRSRFIIPYLLVMVVSMSVLSIITMVLPNSSYSLFSKRSLYLMECIIFLPYLIPCIYIYTYKKIWNHNRRSILQNKRATTL